VVLSTHSLVLGELQLRRLYDVWIDRDAGCRRATGADAATLRASGAFGG
jgi:hypothetical protein